MKIAITGGKGMLGRTLQKKFAGEEVVVADLPEWGRSRSTKTARGTLR